MTDYHVHTPLCQHASGEPIEYVEEARRAGLSEIGFADHNPMPTPFDQWRMPLDQFEVYLAMIDDARATTQFPIRLGMECDFIAGYEPWIEELAARAEFDYLIGSVHYIAPGWDVDNPKFLFRFTEYPVEEIWDLYWRHYVACIRSGLFDFVAHPDLAKKFGHRPTGDLRRYYDPAVQALVETGIAFEINTAGWRKEAAEQYPAFQFIQLAASAGVPVLINSDAHSPQEVGHRFADARALAREAGYTETVRFNQRQASRVPL
jgi:histidinol-phosphatase (PHP family)